MIYTWLYSRYWNEGHRYYEACFAVRVWVKGNSELPAHGEVKERPDNLWTYINQEKDFCVKGLLERFRKGREGEAGPVTGGKNHAEPSLGEKTGR